MERANRIPVHLLAAISLVEAGRWDADRSAIFAWPWTVTAEGRGRFLPSKQAAIAEVRKLRARGIRNIDVGCMQINLKYHPKAFDNLNEAFDPVANVAYAANYLRLLKKETRSWTRAIGSYHSRTPARAKAYRQRVKVRWQEERRRVMNARAAAVREAWASRRAERQAARQPARRRL